MTEALVSNDVLTLDDVPGPDARWHVIEMFALRFDGYESAGSFEACAGLANGIKARFERTGELPDDLTSLRTALYFFQRAHRHAAPDSDPDVSEGSYVGALVSAIRAAVAARPTAPEATPADCPFCCLRADKVERSTSSAFAFLDRFPLSRGHTLVVPRSHVASLFDLGERERAAVWELVAEVREELQRSMRPEGFNIGLNDGEAAGQTVGHAHVHVIPRYTGDVDDPRGGVRWVIPSKAAYWKRGAG